MSKLEDIINTQLDAAFARGVLDERSGITNQKPMIHDLKFNTREQLKDLILELIGQIDEYVIHADDLPTDEVRINDLLKEIEGDLRQKASEL